MANRVSWASRPDTIPSITVPASKSELNRMLVLAALRPGRTEMEGKSDCDDVVRTLACLEALGVPAAETAGGYAISGGGLARLAAERGPRTLDCGSGGTTLRFLMALAAARPARTELRASPQLLSRPDRAYLGVLIGLGARAEKTGRGYVIEGCTDWPRRIEVPADESSQFASALCLVCSALDHPTELVLAGECVSEPYWKLTLDCVRRVGAAASDETRGTVVDPPSAATRGEKVVIEAEGDASSAAVWLCAGALGWTVAVQNYPESARQADTRLLDILGRFPCRVERDDRGAYTVPEAAPDEGVRTLDLRRSPDLAPVLSALAALVPGRTVMVGAGHLRFKESNRIDDLVRAFSAVDIRVEARADGLDIRGPQRPREGTVEPFGDHRLAMAASLLASRTASITIAHPQVVAKSYPGFWVHGRSVGWKVEEIRDGETR